MARLLSSFRHRQPTLTAGVALSFFHPDRSDPAFSSARVFVRWFTLSLEGFAEWSDRGNIAA